VLSIPDGDWAGRTGFVHEAVAQDFASLRDLDAYLCGPPPMIDAARTGFAARGPLHPDWAPEEIAAIVREGARKAATGDGVHRVVRDRRGEPVGVFVMHGRPGRTARVLQIAAAPGREEAVVDAMMARAAALGFSAVTGRAQPWQLDALAARRCVFHKRAATVAHSRDEAILEAFRRGEAFFNGYAGETWLRLIGDAFGD